MRRLKTAALPDLVISRFIEFQAMSHHEKKKPDLPPLTGGSSLLGLLRSAYFRFARSRRARCWATRDEVHPVTGRIHERHRVRLVRAAGDDEPADGHRVVDDRRTARSGARHRIEAPSNRTGGRSPSVRRILRSRTSSANVRSTISIEPVHSALLANRHILGSSSLRFELKEHSL